MNVVFLRTAWNPVWFQAPAVALLLLVSMLPSNALALSQDDADAIPHVNLKARTGFQQYLDATEHKAFAIAPGGAWSWKADAASAELAEKQALNSCEEYTQQKCVLYALDNKVVFDQQQWPTLWAPYASAQQAEAASIGRHVGQRFYDLRFIDSKGNSTSISALRGKVVFVHFWASWCSPCLREFPSLQKLQTELAKRLPDQVEMVMLQIRESFTESRRWAEKNNFAQMPLYDSSSSSDNDKLTLSDGSSIADRQIARVFPSSYVLDKNGLVIFSHFGPVPDWSEYTAFFKHAVQNQQVQDRVATRN